MPRSRVPRLLCAISLAVLTSVLTIGGDAAPASAACQNTYGIQRAAPGLPWVTWGEGRPNANTCDGDGRFYGQVLDAITDGSCVYAQFLEGNIVYTAGQSCTTGGWASFGYIDQTTGTGTPGRSYGRVKRNVTIGESYHDWERQSGY